MRPTGLSKQLAVNLFLQVEIPFVQQNFQEIGGYIGCEVTVFGSTGLSELSQQPHVFHDRILRPELLDIPWFLTREAAASLESEPPRPSASLTGGLEALGVIRLLYVALNSNPEASALPSC